MVRSLLILILFPLGVFADWPDGARVAVNLTFDFYAKTIRWSDQQTMDVDPGAISQGTFGPAVAVPRMFDELITWMKGHDGVWFATCADTAAYVAEDARRQPVGVHVQ